MKNRNIIVIASQPWDIEIGSNCKNIALEFAKQNQVLYVNAPIDNNTLLKHRKENWVIRRRAIIKKDIPALQKIQHNLWSLQPDFIAASINWIPIPHLHDYLNKRNNKKYAACIQLAIKELGFIEFIIFNDSLIMRGFYLKELLKPTLQAYYIRDYLISQPYFKKHGTRLEIELIRKSDIVLTNSVFLKAYALEFNPNSHYVGQGCETDIFSPDIPRAKPTELNNLSSPIIGYIGFLTALRLDINLLEQIALSNKEWIIVLVGPEDEVFRNSNLHKIDNILFTGPRKPEELPSYVQHFDVCINPQLVNELTIGNYPRKIDEYLAMGKPTVGTLTKTMEVFKECCYLASSYEEYSSMIKKAMLENSAEKINQRITLAKSHTWYASVQAIYKALDESLIL